MKVLFITPYPEGVAGSQRFRFEQYFPELKKRNIDYAVSPFMDERGWEILYKKGYLIGKIAALCRGYLRRISDLFNLSKYDFVFIHREASPFGPPLFAWLVAKVFRKKIIFDFDDAIWIRNVSEHNKLNFFLKRFSSANNICKWSYKVSAGNRFLVDYAKQYNSSVIYNPTTIDTDDHHNEVAKRPNNKFVVGWTGSHSTVKYLDELLPVIQSLEEKFDFELHVICDTPPKFQLKSLKFTKWNKETEIDDLLNFTIGIMPLPDNIWSKGKCGFKALQYMALGIPAVVSSVGVNTEIVEHDVNRYICKTPEDWNFYLSKLMNDKEYLHRLSLHTRKKIVDQYSMKSNTGNFLSLFS